MSMKIRYNTLFSYYWIGGLLVLLFLSSFSVPGIDRDLDKSSSLLFDQQLNKFSTLVFSDEFDSEGVVDSSKWLFETIPPRNGSWHNGEKQHYTNRPDNAYVSEGTLKIIAKKEEYTFEGSTKQYTSARLNSKFSFIYGRVDVRAKLPEGVGTWPAIWMLGKNITSIGWPACGEIDIMEHWGHNPTEVSSAIHTIACSGMTDCKETKIGQTIVPDYSSEFHVYSMEWSPDRIEFYLDRKLLYSYNPSEKTAKNWPFTESQYILLNVAMGGHAFDIDPDFRESAMEIDYVRIYQN